ncbi:hypothetical protein C0995_011407, partial [Termitomyces sp. Mi166
PPGPIPTPSINVFSNIWVSWPHGHPSTASAKPWLDGLEHGTSPVLSIAVSLSLHIDTTVSASSDGLSSHSLSPLHFLLAAHLGPTSALVPGSPAARRLLGKEAGWWVVARVPMDG